MSGYPDTIVGMVVLMNGKTAVMNAGPVRMPNMSPVIGKSVVADTSGWKDIGNRHTAGSNTTRVHELIAG